MPYLSFGNGKSITEMLFVFSKAFIVKLVNPYWEYW